MNTMGLPVMLFERTAQSIGLRHEPLHGGLELLRLAELVEHQPARAAHGVAEDVVGGLGGAAGSLRDAEGRHDLAVDRP